MLKALLCISLPSVPGCFEQNHQLLTHVLAVPFSQRYYEAFRQSCREVIGRSCGGCGKPFPIEIVKLSIVPEIIPSYC